MQRVLSLFCITLGLACAGAAIDGLTPRAFAQDAAPDAYLELMRSDVRASRVEILTAALDLSAGQADAFWPIFREYDNEMMQIGDRRVAAIKSFADSYTKMTDTQIAAFAKEYFSIQSDRIKVRKKYFDKVSKSVSPLVAARFTQVENVVAMLVDLQIAAELPLIE